MTNEPKNITKMAPSISLPVKEVASRYNLYGVRPLEYIRIEYVDSISEELKSSEGFFGGSFDINGEHYFTLVDVVPNMDPKKVNIISDLYRARSWFLNDLLEKQTGLCKKDDLENMVNKHLDLFKKEVSKYI